MDKIDPCITTLEGGHEREKAARDTCNLSVLVNKYARAGAMGVKGGGVVARAAGLGRERFGCFGRKWLGRLALTG